MEEDTFRLNIIYSMFVLRGIRIETGPRMQISGSLGKQIIHIDQF